MTPLSSRLANSLASTWAERMRSLYSLPDWMSGASLALGRCSKSSPDQRVPHRPDSWLETSLFRYFLALPVLMLSIVTPMQAGAADAEAMCFAGTGKPRIDVVMCSMALMPAEPLSRATLLTKRARAHRTRGRRARVERSWRGTCNQSSIGRSFDRERSCLTLPWSPERGARCTERSNSSSTKCVSPAPNSRCFGFDRRRLCSCHQ